MAARKNSSQKYRLATILGEAATAFLDDAKDEDVFANDGTSQSGKIFCEMLQLHQNHEWRETARWIKFEEIVESGSNRWSKPHVSTLSLLSLLEIRTLLADGCVLTDVEHTTFSDIIDELASKLTDSELPQLGANHEAEFKELLQKKRVHQFELAARSSALRSDPDHDSTDNSEVWRDRGDSFASQKKEDTNGSVPHADINGAKTKVKKRVAFGDKLPTLAKGNEKFTKKIPKDTEACSVLVGESHLVEKPLVAFIRLKTSAIMADLIEVPVPVKYIFLLLVPQFSTQNVEEIGRVFGTIITDKGFVHTAQNAANLQDILNGIDKFLSQTTVLPPTLWDPKTRIEPPDKSKPEMGEVSHGEDVSEHGRSEYLRRTGKLFGGLIADVKRKLPYYVSDFKDGLHIQVLASFLFVYFTILAPVITFGGLLDDNTDGYMGAIENLLAGAICGAIYCLFAGQPLTIIGSTGPVLVLEGVVYRICSSADLNYLSVRFWIGMWTVVLLLIMVATDASVLVLYITRFTEESFTVLIALIYIYNAVVNIVAIYNVDSLVAIYPHGPGHSCECVPAFNESTMFDYSWVEETVKEYHFGKNLSQISWLDGYEHHYNDTHKEVTGFHVDWSTIPLGNCTKFHGVLTGNSCHQMVDAFLMSLILMIGTCSLAFALKSFRNSLFLPTWVRQLVGDFAVIISIALMVSFDYLVGVNTPKLNVPDRLQPTNPSRGWFVYPFNGNPWWTCVVTVFPAILHCILLFMDQQITAVIVNRKEHKLVKGCGYHLDLFVLSLLFAFCATFGLPYFVAGTVMCLNHVASLKIWEPAAPGENPSFTRCREQRVSGIMTYVLLGLSITATKFLQQIPTPVLYGIFLYMGFSALQGVQFIDRLLLMLTPMKYQPDYIYIRHVRIQRIHLFTLFQLACFGILWAVKLIKILSIGFPLVLIIMVAVRKLVEQFIFSKEELKYLDDELPDFALRKREDARRNRSRNISVHLSFGSGGVVEVPLVASSDKAVEGLRQHLRRESAGEVGVASKRSGLTRFQSVPQDGSPA